MSAAKANKPKRSWKRVAIRLSISLAISGVLIAISFPILRRDATERFNIYAAYSHALHEYYEQNGREPPDLPSMEAAYMASGSAESPLPPPPPFERPEYRPIEGLPAGEYIIIIEPPSPHWYSLTRTVIYASTGGDTRVVAEPRTSIDDLIAEDDNRRATLSEPRP